MERSAFRPSSRAEYAALHHQQRLLGTNSVITCPKSTAKLLHVFVSPW